MSDDRVIAEKIATQLNIAILVLRAAQAETPERVPFREVDESISQALGALLEAESVCERIAGDE